MSVLAPSARLVGTRVPRTEDARLVTGRGSFVDDVVVPGMLHAAFARSDVARGRIVQLDVVAARRSPGVVAVLTAADLNPLLAGSMSASAVRRAGPSECSPRATSASSAIRMRS
jgi:CO/xanthine dehydrogenase Mo-binding subunit